MRFVHVTLWLAATAAIGTLSVGAAVKTGLPTRLVRERSFIAPPRQLQVVPAPLASARVPPTTTARQLNTLSPAASILLDRLSVRRMSALEQPILAQINIVRRAHGLRPLQPSTHLTAAAIAHVRALASTGQFRHQWPDGTVFALWIRRFYPVGHARTWSVGENLLWSAGHLDAKHAVRMWLASPPHRRIMLSPGWRQLGIGVVEAQQAPGEYAGQDVLIASAVFGDRD